MPDVELARTDQNAYHLPDRSFSSELDRVKIDGLRYRLLLLPVWMVTLNMEDGTRRPAVVNGQTGEVIVSASFVSPHTIIAGPNRATQQLPPIQPLPRRHPNVIRPLEPR
jgi:hypothetical protein